MNPKADWTHHDYLDPDEVRSLGEFVIGEKGSR